MPGRFTAGLYAFPTTYVVDQDGNIVGQPIVGAVTSPEQTKALNALIEQALYQKYAAESAARR